MNEENPLQRLANAIVLQAVEDYRHALGGGSIRGKLPECIISEVERFFRSDWFYMLTNLNGEILINRLRREVVR
jgi:hypothetical protein